MLAEPAFYFGYILPPLSLFFFLQRPLKLITSNTWILGRLYGPRLVNKNEYTRTSFGQNAEILY